MASVRTLYLVQQRTWQVTEGDLADWMAQSGRMVLRRNEPGEGRPVKFFADAAAAEAFCRAEERTMRNAVNPFDLGASMADRTSLGVAQLHDWLLDAGLTPPKVSGTPEVTPPDDPFRDAKANAAHAKYRVAWHAWWKKTYRRMTERQRAKAWEAFDKIRFFEVVADEG